MITPRLLTSVFLSGLAVVLTACGGGGGTPTPPPTNPTITSVAVTCAPTSVTSGQTSQCSANVQGTGNFSTAVTWSASAGIISSTGLLTAPATAQAVTVTAKSTADQTKSGTASVTVTLPPPTITSVAVTCTPTSITTAQTSQCSANVQGTGNFDNTVTWSASAGTISNSGVLTPPATAQTVTVTARSVADQNKTGTASVTVTVPTNITGVTLSCPESSLPQGLTEQCTATVQGTVPYNASVNWSATSGTISAGLFTAPEVSGNVTITATAAGDSSKFATKTVTTTTPQKASFDYKGINHVSWWLDDYTKPEGAPSRAALAATGANYAGVLATQYLQTYTSTAISRTNNTPTDAAVVTAISELHSHGVKVMLKPHVDTQDGRWRGELQPTDPVAWFTAYRTFILHYAQMAKDNNVEMLCIGTEFKTMTTGAYRTNWIDIINAIRAVYPGKLTYAANATSAGDEFTSVSFWDQVDVIGLDGYFPLTSQNDPTITQLVNAWSSNVYGQNIVSMLTNFASAHPGKPIVFTEIGYRSVAGANTAPWDFSTGTTPDNTEQQNCYEAMYQVWSKPGSPINGHFWWSWAVPAPGPNDTGYEPLGKPAETVLRNWQ